MLRSSPVYENIYQLALQKDSTRLEEFLSQPGVKIDECADTMLTAAGKLAFEGNRHAAELLRELGADANEIAYGAARGCKKKYVNSTAKPPPMAV